MMGPTVTPSIRHRSCVVLFFTGCLFVLLPVYFSTSYFLTQYPQNNHFVASRRGQLATIMTNSHDDVGRSFNSPFPTKPNKGVSHTGRATKQEESSHSEMMKNNHSAAQVIMTTLPTEIMMKTQARKLHIYIYPKGRLGNWLFQIASGFGLAQRYNHSVCLGNGFKGLVSIFPNLKEMPFTEINDKLDAFRIRESGFAKCSSHFEDLADKGNVLLVGYLQCFKYFSGSENDLRSILQFKDTLVANATQTLADIRRSYISKHGPVPSLTYVGLHIRIGDLNTTIRKKHGYHTADSEYIYKSMFYFQRKYGNVAFVLRTDTANAVKDYVLLETVFDPPAASAAQDLALLSLCNHTITSVGTYSWWAGWLAGGEVAYYHERIGKDTRLGKEFVAEDFFPSHWLPISNMTRQDIERVVESS